MTPKMFPPNWPDGNFLGEDIPPILCEPVSGFSRSNGLVRGKILAIDSSVTVPWITEDGEQHPVVFSGLIETTSIMGRAIQALLFLIAAIGRSALGLQGMIKSRFSSPSKEFSTILKLISSQKPSGSIIEPKHSAWMGAHALSLHGAGLGY